MPFFAIRSLWGRLALVLLLAWGVSMPFALAQTADHPASITVAIDDDYPPYIFRNADGQLQGIRKEMWDLWSVKTGIAVQIVATDWSKAQQRMLSGEADVIDDLFKTPQREKALHYSEAYANVESPVFFHQSIAGINGIRDLHGFTIGVVDGDAAIEWLAANGMTNLRKYPNYEGLVKAAGQGEVRVFCMGKPVALHYLYKHKLENEFRFSPALYFGQLHWATHKGNDALHQIVAAGFAEISPEERARIEEKWQGSSLRPGFDSRYVQYALALLLAALLIILITMALNVILRRRVAQKTSELTASLNALRASERYNRMLFENTMLGLRLSRLDGTLVDANQAFADIVGYTLPEALQLTLDRLTPEAFRDQDNFHRETLIATGHYGPYDKEYLHRSGRRVPVRVTGALIERNGERFVLSAVEDISAQKAADERINFLAMHDALTGLPNRVVAQDRFEQAAVYADRVGAKVALLLFDLDNFKEINDALGHTSGDRLLKAVAARVSLCMRDTDTLSRHSGDEFVIVQPTMSGTDAVVANLVNVMNSLQQPFTVDGYELSVTVSIGVAVYPDDGRDFDTLMKNADIAMYQAKDAGRNTYRFFDQNMQAGAMDRMNLSSGLRRALERQELLLHYQPLIDLQSGAVVGAEALLRWNHPEQGMIPPARFIPVAEDTGLIVHIGEWVLREACRQAAVWQRAGWPEFQIAVNLSAVQFRRDSVEQAVLAALEESHIDPTLLELELTESILISNTESVLATVRRLKSLGVKLSIDDFGTGYSSLSYLKRFAVDKLKIDRSFVRDLTNDPDDAAIIRAVIQMARSLGLRILAEGVEDARAAEWLRLFQCNEAQGYYFAKPMDAEQFGDYLRLNLKK